MASSLGDELKGVAKQKATSFVKEQFGLGFKEELQSAGGHRSYPGMTCGLAIVPG